MMSGPYGAGGGRMVTEAAWAKARGRARCAGAEMAAWFGRNGNVSVPDRAPLA
jgi:acetyl-CoA acetyltransferase